MPVRIDLVTLIAMLAGVLAASMAMAAGPTSEEIADRLAGAIRFETVSPEDPADFRGEPFEGSKYLLAWAEELNEIKTVCPSGKKATMNARVDADGEQILDGDQVAIGHNYIALSRREFGLHRVSPIGYVPPEE